MIDLILAESDLGVMVDGSEQGPGKIYENIEKKNINRHHEIRKMPCEKEKEEGNKKRNLENLVKYNEMLFDEIVNDKEFCVTLGGDHSIAIASGLASKEKHGNIGIIWVDAHGDFNTFKTTITGNIHGLPLAVLDGIEKNDLADFFEGEFFNPKNTVILGARDLDLLEKENLEEAGVTIITTEDIKNNGAQEMTKKAIEVALDGTDGMHISYDIDVIDPEIAPGVSVPAVDGISEKEAFEVLDELLKSKDIKSIDVVEYNPIKDIDNKTLKIATKITNKIIKNY